MSLHLIVFPYDFALSRYDILNFGFHEFHDVRPKYVPTASTKLWEVGLDVYEGGERENLWFGVEMDEMEVVEYRCCKILEIDSNATDYCS